jgi:retron-type reverse transcriptase
VQFDATVPSVVDRVAQAAAAMALEPGVEPIFHEDSYGYRPGRSPVDAVAVCRERCFKKNWVVDLDIRAFFDSVPWDLMLRAVARHTDQKWIVLYVERWLKAPMRRPDGTLLARVKGTPQGALCSAEHNPPYEQCWVMRSAGVQPLLGGGLTAERCA